MRRTASKMLGRLWPERSGSLRSSRCKSGGGGIDRSRPLRFSFDGVSYGGFAGDTLASALLANGVRTLGRSFKYHRPRGLLAAGTDEPNALVSVGGDPGRITPNLRATEVALYDGLVARSQNRFPSLRFDLGRINDILSPLLPAGFYYKTFMWPRGFWKRVYEPVIRASAGLGRAPGEADADRYAQRYAHCDVLVIGGGPAGLAAALAAGRSGARVILCDENEAFGGSLCSDRASRINGRSTEAWVHDALAELGRLGNVIVLARTTAFSYGPHNMLALAERLTDHLAKPPPGMARQRLWQVRAVEVVLATGAIERPLVFEQNDLPGIMLAGAVQEYLNRYGVVAGRRAVVVTAHDGAYRAALDLRAAGVRIEAIADLRAAPDSRLVRAARAAGIPVLCATTIQRAYGRSRVHGVRLAPVGPSGSGTAGFGAGKVGRGRRFAADLVLMSGGFTPSVHLFSQSLGRLRFDDRVGSYVPGLSVQREVSAGACRGRYGLDCALTDGVAAGAGAAGRAGFAARTCAWTVQADAPDDSAFAGLLPRRGKGLRAKAFVDFQNDVTAKDIMLATREGFCSIEHVKRYTTTGMATDQGKTSNMNTLGIVAAALGLPIPQVGLTSFRMPFTPTSFGLLAGVARGVLFDPERRTPIDGWAQRHGAVFEDVALWKRARYFPRGDETMQQAVARECLAVRSGVGIFDASTLGKIEVVGADAAEFMNRMYVNAWSKLAIGRCRYGLLCGEHGFILDDGVVGRIAADRFHVTTTTGGAARVLGLMEDYLQTEWPQLDVWLTSTTEQWAVIALQGPKAREVLAPLVDGLDISSTNLPHMGLLTGRIGGIAMRLFRVSFTGELGFEVNVPARHGRQVWERIWQAGEAHGITAYGTETMHVLRAEKGYIVVGQDTDGTATPDDAGCGWTVSKLKPDFVGKRSLSRAAMTATARHQLVGLLADEVLEEGAQIVECGRDGAAKLGAPGDGRAGEGRGSSGRQGGRRTVLGHVTSAYESAALGRPIALAMLSGGRARHGETLHVPIEGRLIGVRVCEPVFYDPKGSRLDA